MEPIASAAAEATARRLVFMARSFSSVCGDAVPTRSGRAATACRIRLRSHLRMQADDAGTGVGAAAISRRAPPAPRAVAAGGRKRRLELDRLAALRMNEAQSPRVQEHPVEAQRRGTSTAARERAVEGEVAVLRIADDRVAGVGEMDADLVRAAGLEGDVEQAEVAEPARDPNQADRAPAARIFGVDGAHVAAAVGGHVLAQRDVDHLERRRPVADDQRRIALGDGPPRLARAQVVLQRDQRRPRLGDEEQTRGLLVEAVDELEELARPGAPHLLDHAEALAAAAVDGDAGRLVDADDRFVLVDDGELARRRLPGARCGRRRAPAGSGPRRRAPGGCRRRPCPC